MKWNRFTIKTKTEAEDMIICTLAEIGVEGVEIQDHQPLTEEDKAQMFVDIMPEWTADDGIAYLNFYLEEDADKENILRDVRNVLKNLRTLWISVRRLIEESQTEDKDRSITGKSFPSVLCGRYSDRLHPGRGKRRQGQDDSSYRSGDCIRTGTHETTQLVIRQLKKYVKPGIELLDVGTGAES